LCEIADVGKTMPHIFHDAKEQIILYLPKGFPLIGRGISLKICLFLYMKEFSLDVKHRR
jgi:hypothetical protein